MSEPENEKRWAPVSSRVTPEVRGKLEAKAKEQGTTVSTLVARMLATMVGEDGRGYSEKRRR